MFSRMQACMDVCMYGKIKVLRVWGEHWGTTNLVVFSVSSVQSSHDDLDPAPGSVVSTEHEDDQFFSYGLTKGWCYHPPSTECK